MDADELNSLPNRLNSRLHAVKTRNINKVSRMLKHDMSKGLSHDYWRPSLLEAMLHDYDDIVTLIDGYGIKLNTTTSVEKLIEKFDLFKKYHHLVNDRFASTVSIYNSEFARGIIRDIPDVIWHKAVLRNGLDNNMSHIYIMAALKLGMSKIEMRVDLMKIFSSVNVISICDSSLTKDKPVHEIKLDVPKYYGHTMKFAFPDGSIVLMFGPSEAIKIGMCVKWDVMFEYQ